MHDDTQLVTLEINPVIAEPKAVKSLALAFQMAELVQVALEHLPGNAAKFSQDVELQFARHLGQFRRAGRIKNDLKLHGASVIAAAQLSTFNARFEKNASRCRRA